MIKELIVDCDVFQTRVATLEDGDLVDLFIERTGKERIVGNIYLGRVQNVLPGMQAAFVDIGLEKNAFLYAGDILADTSDLEFPDQTDKPVIAANIRDIVKPGQDVLVQILKEPVGNKGARVTTHITLPGRNLVLMPTVDYIGVSRRIEDEEERVRLRLSMEEKKPHGMGVIVRTAAINKSEEEFEADFDFLLKLWQRVSKMAKTAIPPKLLHGEESLVFRTIRDLFADDVTRILINDHDACEKIRAIVGILAPERVNDIVLFQKEEDIFDYYELETKIDKLLSRKVWLKSGGYIIIDQTEAFTIIDVNTGKYVGNDNLQETILKTNQEAAFEIARQLRLRDIGGIIIIDFIDMETQEDKELLLADFQLALRKDSTKSNVVGMTGLGLVEMTRKKIRKSLSNTLQTTCWYCKGDGRVKSAESVALEVRKKLLHDMKSYHCSAWVIHVHPSVAQEIEQSMKTARPILPIGYSIYLRSIAAQHVEEFRVQPIFDRSILQNFSNGIKPL